MIREVRFAPPALADVVAAGKRYAEVDESLGVAFVDAATDFAYSLVESPKRYREIRPGLRQALLRRFHHHFIYSIEEEAIVVVAVVSSRRDPVYIDRLLSKRRGEMD